MSKFDFLSNYFSIIQSQDIPIDKNEVFFREKYNEILNYIKVILSLGDSSSDNIKSFDFKGSLLINANFRADVVEFIKLICKNYYLNLYQPNFEKICENPDEFLQNLKQFLKRIKGSKEVGVLKDDENITENSNQDNSISKSRDINKNIILIEQDSYFNALYEDGGFLKKYVSLCYSIGKIPNFLEGNIIFIWINYDYNDVILNYDKIIEYFDLIIRIPKPNIAERESIIRNFKETIENIDFNDEFVLRITEGWEVKDIKDFLKLGLLKLIIKNENEDSIDLTNILQKLLENQEFIPTIPVLKKRYDGINKNEKESMDSELKRESFPENSKQKAKDAKKINIEKEIIGSIQEMKPTEFMVNQLYEEAASKHYNELLIVIDKLRQEGNLSKNERSLLAKYPFILNDEPNIAKINLEKAKKRIDIIKQAFSD